MRHSLFLESDVSPLLVVGTVVLAIVIFIADTIASLEIAVAMLYVGVVLICARLCTERGIILVATCCWFLTALSFYLTMGSEPAFSGVVNTILSMAVIALTTFLVIYGQPFTIEQTAAKLRAIFDQ